MHVSSRFAKLFLVVAILLISVVWAYAAAPISNPLCGLQQISNYSEPTGLYMANISGDGNRAVFVSSPTNIDAALMDLNSMTKIDTVDIGFPVLDYDGNRIAYYGNGNYGSNADGSFELFLWDNGVKRQLTNLNN